MCADVTSDQRFTRDDVDHPVKSFLCYVDEAHVQRTLEFQTHVKTAKW